MPFKKPVPKSGAAINEVEIGVGAGAITLGGENVLPFYSFDGAIKNSPKIGIEVSDVEFADAVPGIAELYAGTSSVAERVAKAAAVPGADFVALRFESADPNGLDVSSEDCAKVAKEAYDAIGDSKALVIVGCKNNEKDAQLFDKVAAALEGKNVLFVSAKEENYKTVAASVGLAYNQKISAESAVDINLAKQLNVLVTQMGVNAKNVVMNVGTASAGYGFEYVVSTIDRIKSAAMNQNDATLQMPIITPVSTETWGVKEASATEEDMPQWGNPEQRGIDMEVMTAVSVIASGSNAVILRHPKSIEALSALVNALA
ncbi:MAG: acetyl-CoA decarbonylase/synthase complex subunit delta [Oscillospiraceae bacterium]|jgi:acetyl-CoA decarbonylase/synthase complex subunit delta|nr:acetyl-CoA decarbonylase/synthase complex subunit delta [Oscillospiraceae bacterium]